jgi:hypothetical protein
MKTYGGVEVQLHTFLTSELDVGEWSGSRPGSYIQRKESPLLAGKEAGWVTQKVLTQWREISPPRRELKLGRPARSLVTILTELPRLLDGVSTEAKQIQLSEYKVQWCALAVTIMNLRTP